MIDGKMTVKNNQVNLRWSWNGNIDKGYTILQEGYANGRKRGWWQCKYCGMMGSFSDTNIVKEHISGVDCPATPKQKKMVDKAYNKLRDLK